MLEIDFSQYSSVKIGAKMRLQLLKECKDYGGVQMVGLGNNLLVSPQACNLAILDRCFDTIEDRGSFVEVGARTSAQKLFSYFKAHNLGGLEFLSALPGSVGGLLKMNAGMKAYQMSDVILQANINGAWLDLEALGLGYRSSAFQGVVFGVRLQKIQGFRKSVLQECQNMRFHPKKPSFGSCFKNPSGDFAGRLLEAVGLMGFNLGRVGFSEKHANFLINLGGAHFEEALDLIELAKERVFNAFGIILQEEVCILV
ncbi:UDP-N-acetylenolpyruvoylglucosamine reductase MurB [Helicobacter bizzozeronii]|uniref:UDP-N-acetylmuramate dehydrogenase n=1 Tax=Helicobacter bizzozeronii TaxID=56877 RepID=UPI00244D8BB7|nr:UDP-N-acetylmuramate dehydrogenase [Helicobacter bizzozeronii]GMB93726.1 UDP-N-acetylenolpyruvoylglucosamine reductase MurB [Helicobacter bizzozeronii]